MESISGSYAGRMAPPGMPKMSVGAGGLQRRDQALRAGHAASCSSMSCLASCACPIADPTKNPSADGRRGVTRVGDGWRLSPRVGCVQECPCACDHRSRRVRGPSSESAPASQHPGPPSRMLASGDLLRRGLPGADAGPVAVARRPGSRTPVPRRRSPGCRRRPAPRRCARRRPPGRRGCRGGSAGAARSCGLGSAGTTTVGIRPSGSTISRSLLGPSRSRGPPPRTAVTSTSAGVEAELEVWSPGAASPRRRAPAAIALIRRASVDVAAGDAARRRGSTSRTSDVRLGQRRRRGGGWPPRRPRRCARRARGPWRSCRS